MTGDGWRLVDRNGWANINGGTDDGQWKDRRRSVAGDGWRFIEGWKVNRGIKEDQ